MKEGLYHRVSVKVPDTCELSVVIPVCNEINGLDACYSEVKKILIKSGYTFEIILVDDGSTDGSLVKMLDLSQKDPLVGVIELKKNYGQQKALLAGLRESKGDVVITYDADLQFDPECIPQLADRIFNGADIASGIRKQRNDSFLLNRVPSLVGQYLINRVLRIRQADFGAVKAYSRQIVDEILLLPADFMVIPATAYSLSRNFEEISVKHQARKSGQSKWSILNRIETYLDIYVMYAQSPFEWIMIFGFLSIAASFLFAIGFFIYYFLLDVQVASEFFLLDMFLFLFGFLLLVFSLVGKLVVRIFRRQEMGIDSFVRRIYPKSPS